MWQVLRSGGDEVQGYQILLCESRFSFSSGAGQSFTPCRRWQVHRSYGKLMFIGSFRVSWDPRKSRLRSDGYLTNSDAFIGDGVKRRHSPIDLQKIWATQRQQFSFLRLAPRSPAAPWDTIFMPLCCTCNTEQSRPLRYHEPSIRMQSNRRLLPNLISSISKLRREREQCSRISVVPLFQNLWVKWPCVVLAPTLRPVICFAGSCPTGTSDMSLLHVPNFL